MAAGGSGHAERGAVKECGGMLAHPVQAVSGHLAEPARLGDWLPEVTWIPAG